MAQLLIKQKPLGEVLREHETLTELQLAHALALQKKSGGLLGDITIGEGLVDYRSLYRAIAAQHHLPFVNLLSEPPDPSLMEDDMAQAYLKLLAIPWRRNGQTLIVAAADLSSKTQHWCRHAFGENIQMAVTSPFDIRRTVECRFGTAMERESRVSLWHNLPEASARITLSTPQSWVVASMAAVAFGTLVYAPTNAALFYIALSHIAYTLTMLFKMLVFSVGIPLRDNRQQTAQLPADEKTLPVYTVLIPMYREASSMAGILKAMRQMDYPSCKLDIKLVLESDDEETYAEAMRLKPHYHFEIIRVPPGNPRTKPKACNYALKFARGEYVTVFDADDRPDRLQLKKAVQAFRTFPDNVACLQARLNYYNVNDNLLTRFFSLEYTLLFHFMLYGLERIGIPIPLGGTSNHIALDKLRAIGEWDPYNVTEDADLGVRIAAAGLRTAMLDSFTMEESPVRVMPWIRQRSRWIKGYMQTWLVHMRHPHALWKTLGIKGFIGFQFFVGLSCFTFLTAPLVWGLSLLWIGLASLHHADFPEWLAWLTVINLVLNLATHWGVALYCAARYRKYQAPMFMAALLFPLYLVLHSIASYKALWQLIFRPHFWEKTMHGLAKRENSPTAERA